MPKSVKKKTPAKKKSPVKKAVAKKASPGEFMKKLLEQKEAARKLQLEQQKNSVFRFHAQGGQDLHPREQSFSKFSGPRRKAA